MFDVQQAFDDYSRDNHVDPTCVSYNLLDRCAHGSRCHNRHKVTLKDKALKWFRQKQVLGDGTERPKTKTQIQ